MATNLGSKSATSAYSPLFVALTFRNGLQYRGAESSLSLSISRRVHGRTRLPRARLQGVSCAEADATTLRLVVVVVVVPWTLVSCAPNQPECRGQYVRVPSPSTPDGRTCPRCTRRLRSTRCLKSDHLSVFGCRSAGQLAPWSYESQFTHCTEPQSSPL